MAIKLGLISFEFNRYKDLEYEADKDRVNFSTPSYLGHDVQPVVERAFKKIVDCIINTISCDLSIGSRRIINMNNFLHVGTLEWNAELHDYSLESPQMCIMATVKFYRLSPSKAYKVTIDIEEMTSTMIGVDKQSLLFKVGFNNERLANLASSLNKEFDLNDKVEMIPIILRGYYNAPRFIKTTDNRLVEYDVKNKKLCYLKSDHQEIMILQSKSLGKMMLLNKQPVICELDKRLVNSMMDKDFIDYDDKRVLILGGGDGSLLNELLMIERVKFVQLIEIDMSVLEIASKFFRQNNINLNNLEGDRYRIINQDARKFLLDAVKNEMTWDVIFNDMTYKPHGSSWNGNFMDKRSELDMYLEGLSQQTNPWFFLEPFFNLSMKCLQIGGIFIMKLNSVNNSFDKQTFDKFLSDSKFKLSIAIHQSFVPTLMEVCYFYTITKLDDDHDELIQ